ncbi:MAG: lysylphosphatidylglycerol synthase domain-containing protein [Tenuifilaceae bacterium]|jgi:hypothetical protein|nr:lysylphosphatidylglycerol synthase domain-containing protein [Tenuifilaceae bacterium]
MIKHKRYIYFVAIAAAYGYVGFKLFENRDIDISIFSFGNSYFLALAILLTSLNWLVETQKWRIVIRRIYQPSFSEALKVVLYGAGIGLFTPNRMGDPVGRVAMLNPEFRTRGAAMAIVCSMSQQLATILFGLIGLVAWYGIDFYSEISIKSITMGMLVLASLALTLFVIFRFKRIATWVQSKKLFSSLLKNESLIIKIDRLQILKIVLLSIFRYTIFSSQLVLLLIFFGFTGNASELYPAIFISYLLASVIPSISVAELGFRVGFGLHFIGAIWPNAMGIATASIVLWIINVGLPGLIGVWMPFGKSEDKR